MKNPNIKIFAISGKAQHGKDTFANILYEELTNKGHKAINVSKFWIFPQRHILKND